MFLRLTQFGCNRGWHDLTVYTTKNIKNLGQKIQTLGKASNASLVGAKTVSGLWPARRLVSVANATPRAFTWNINFDYEQKDCLDESEKEKKALSNWHMSLGCVGKRERHQSGETRVRSKGGVQSE